MKLCSNLISKFVTSSKGEGLPKNDKPFPKTIYKIRLEDNLKDDLLSKIKDTSIRIC